MRAVYYTAFQQPPEIRTVPDPAPAADGVVIRVGAAGLCRSDWHGWMGHDPDVQLPHVPGHEFAGVIEEVGPQVRRWRAGDRVTVPFAVGCGDCDPCRRGNPHICDRYFQPGFTAWGAFAERVAIPHADLNLVALPPGLSAVDAASLGCRFTTAFRAVVDQGAARPGDWVAVHGCGGVGLAAVLIAHALGAQVIAVDVREEALTLARTLGARHTLRTGDTEGALAADALPAAIHDLTGGGAHVSLDALGSRTTCRNSILGLRKQGRHIQVGLLLGVDRDPPVPMGTVIARELTLWGSHGMPAHAFPRLLELIQSGAIPPGQLVQRTIPLEEAPSALVDLGAFRSLGVTVINRFHSPGDGGCLPG